MEKLLTINELSEFLGISVQTIYNRRNKGLDLPSAIKIGTSLRYRIIDVQAWVEKQREPSKSVAVSEPIARQCSAARRRGRPTKAESIAARNRAAQLALH